MSSTSTAIATSVLHGPKDLRIQSARIDPPAPDELQIAIRSTTLCGSDLHYYTHFRNGDIHCNSPLSLGHESSGIICAVGSSIPPTSFTIGDRVALEVGLPCESCPLCLSGRYNICPQMRFRSSAKSTPHFWGTLQQRINHPAKWCHKIPDRVSFTAAALAEPLAVAIHSTRRSPVEPGSSVLVIGAGAVGLLVAAMANMAGASRVLVADINDGRVGFAREKRWATHTYTVSQTRSPSLETAYANAKEMLAVVEKPGGVDVVFECTGAEASLQSAIYAARSGGAVMMIGMGTPVMNLPISAAALREVDLRGGFRYAGCYPVAVELLGSGRLGDVESLVTHRFDGMGNVSKAFEMAGRVTDDEGKLVVKVECAFPEV